MIEKLITKYSDLWEKNSKLFRVFKILHFREHTFFLSWFYKLSMFFNFWFFEILCKLRIFREHGQFTKWNFLIFFFSDLCRYSCKFNLWPPFRKGFFLTSSLVYVWKWLDENFNNVNGFKVGTSTWFVQHLFAFRI